jgi:hypothetical protein
MKGRTEQGVRKGKFLEIRKSYSYQPPIMRLAKIGGNVSAADVQ